MTKSYPKQIHVPGRPEVHELSLRTRPAGGRVKDSIVPKPCHCVDGHDRIILLIHGFNVSKAEARKEYSHLRKRLSSINVIADLYWPGDTGVPLIKNLKFKGLSEVKYPVQIKTAIDCAEKLAKFLRTIRGREGRPATVYLVAHSLGCRLTLEMLRILWEENQLEPVPEFPAIFLMAAAVPETMLDDGGRLTAGTRLSDARIVLHSKNDCVLRGAFFFGQKTAAILFGRTEEAEKPGPTAVGSYGVTGAVSATAHPMDWLDHGGYWSSIYARNWAAIMLGEAVPRMPEIHILESRCGPVVWLRNRLA